MFRSLRASKVNTDHIFAVTIGPSEKQTLARWHLKTPEDVVSAISMLNNLEDAEDVEEVKGTEVTGGTEAQP